MAGMMNDAETTYGGGAVNTRTMGMNPYQQFQPRRMDQLFSLLNNRRQPMGMGGGYQPQARPQYNNPERANPGPMQRNNDMTITAGDMYGVNTGFKFGPGAENVNVGSMDRQQFADKAAVRKLFGSS